MPYQWENFKKIISNKKGRSFDSLARINFIIFGDYSNGLTNDYMQKLNNSINNCFLFKELVRNFAYQCFPKIGNEALLGYEHRIEIIVKKKVKIYLVFLASKSVAKKIKEYDLKHDLSKYYDVSIDIYDPNNEDLLSKDRDDVIGMSSFKFFGDILLHIDVGVQISEESLEKLFEILLKYLPQKELPSFKGNGYWLTKGLHR